MAKKSNILIIQGLEYHLPEQPPLEEIRNSHKPKKEQFYERDITYQQWGWNMDSDEGELWYEHPEPGQMEWYEQAVHKLIHGEWLMINGVPTYFNADACFFQQWFVMLTGYYPIFKETSLEVFRFWELCRIDPGCLGDCEIKGRRLGMSSMSASRKLRILIVEKNRLMGIVSKTGKDAQEMFFMVKNGIENLPPFLMPELNKVTEKELHVAKPSGRITKKNSKLNADRGRNNRLNWANTAENAYDGRGMYDLTIDEAAKFEEANVLSLLSIISDSLVAGAIVKGKISVFSTVNKGDKGGNNFRQIWDNADHINGKKDRWGRTANKLKRAFFPAYRGYLGYIGKYGESIIETPTKEQTEFLKVWVDEETGQGCPDPTIGAKDFLQETRKMLENDPELLAEEKRKNPFEWEEVFEGANNKCHFNNPKEINLQIERVKTALELNPRMYRRGWFVRTDENKRDFIDDTNGMWYILDLLKEDERNKFVIKYGEKTPANTDYGAGGVDTFANSESTAEEGSDACMVIHKRYNGIDPDNSGMPIAVYIGRPENKLKFFNQIFWAAEYYGIKMLIERAPTDWLDYAEQKGLKNYLIKTKRNMDGKDVYGVAPQNHELREQHLTEMVEYIDVNVEKVWFLRILKDLIPFNVKDRLKFDAPMAWGYALMACKEKFRNVAPLPRKSPMVRVFNLSRNRSA